MILNIDEINKKTKDQICYDTINKLKDFNLINEYKNCKSVKNKNDKLLKILQEEKIEENKQKNIIEKYLFELIPAGTKGNIRGNKFNNIIKEEIILLNLDNKKFELCFEKICNICLTEEKPDWYIVEISTKKVIIGFNQLDIWNGGHQLNRGYKYIIDNKYNTKNSKLLCVICNDIILKNKNKTYKLFDVGFTNNTLCYIKNLKKIIKNFFNL